MTEPTPNPFPTGNGSPTLREQLVRLRQDSGVSQAELAQWIGVTQTAVSYWESGRRQPGLDDVERWAAALGASPSLLQGSPTAGSNSLAGDLVGRLTAALLAEPWNTWPKSAHGEHRFDSGCAICQCDVVRLAAFVVRFMEPEMLVREVDAFHAQGAQATALRQAADAWEALGRPGEPSPIGVWLRCRANQLEHGACAPPPDRGLSDRIDAALRTVGLARNLAAYRDALLPVVEAALAEQTQRAETAERAAHVFCDQRDDARSDAASAWQNAEDWHEVAQAKERRAEQAEALLREFVSDTPCDPHPGNGFCQTHGERKPCPQAQAKALLAALDQSDSQPSRVTETCGDEHAEDGRHCTLPRGHDTHRSGGEAWTYLRDDTIDGLTQRAETAEARLAELESALNWQTSCTSCARVLDSAYAETMRAEKAEAAVQRLRDDLPKLERAALMIAATDAHGALREFAACIRAALGQTEATDA